MQYAQSKEQTFLPGGRILIPKDRPPLLEVTGPKTMESTMSVILAVGSYFFIMFSSFYNHKITQKPFIRKKSFTNNFSFPKKV